MCMQGARRHAALVNVGRHIKAQSERVTIADKINGMQFILYMPTMLFDSTATEQKRHLQCSDTSCCCGDGCYLCPHRRAGACNSNSESSSILDVGTRMFAAERNGVAVHIRTQHAMSTSHMGVIMQAMPMSIWCNNINDHFALPVSLPPRKISASAFAVVNELDNAFLDKKKTKSRMTAKLGVHRENVSTE